MSELYRRTLLYKQTSSSPELSSANMKARRTNRTDYNTFHANTRHKNLDDNTHHPENVIIGPHFRPNLACPTVIFNPAKIHPPLNSTWRRIFSGYLGAST